MACHTIELPDSVEAIDKFNQAYLRDDRQKTKTELSRLGFLAAHFSPVRGNQNFTQIAVSQRVQKRVANAGDHWPTPNRVFGGAFPFGSVHLVYSSARGQFEAFFPPLWQFLLQVPHLSGEVVALGCEQPTPRQSRSDAKCVTQVRIEFWDARWLTS